MPKRFFKSKSRNDSDSPEQGPSENEASEVGSNILRHKSYFHGRRISIPVVTNRYFSFKKLWAFAGPGFLMSIAYLDPGNIESDLRCGSIARYTLLWVLLLSSVMGLFIQRLAARLGVVTGFHLAEMCYKQYKKIPRLILWVMVEIAIIASDAQQVIGTAIAIYLLSNKVVPLWAGVIITIVDTITFLCFDKYGLRKLELVFGLFITVMCVSFGYQYIISKPNHVALVKGTFVPLCENCNYDAFLQGIAIIGAIIMPHNLYLHSALVISRDTDKTDVQQIKEANKYFFIEASLAVFCSSLVNIFVTSVFAGGLYKVTNKELVDKCRSYVGNETIFPDNDDYVEANLYTGGIFLGCTYGEASRIIWGVGLLASGQSSTMTGTYAGQFAMEGFLNLQWARWMKVFVTRIIAIAPTLCLSVFTHMEEITLMNDIMNVVNCVQLPFAAIPIIAFTSNRQIMGEEFVNSWTNKVVALTLGFVVVSINSYFVVDTVIILNPDKAVLGVVVIVGVVYLFFCVYLSIHMTVLMCGTNLLKYDFIKNYIIP